MVEVEFQLRVLSLYGSPWFELLRSDNGAREKNWGNGFCSVSVFKEESDWKKVKRKRKGKGKGKGKGEMVVEWHFCLKNSQISHLTY